MKVFAYIKEHPLMIVLIVGVGILALVLLGGSGGGSQTAVVSSGPSDADVAAATSLQIAQTQAGVQTHGIDASVVAQANEQSFKLAEDQLNAQTASYQSKLGADVSLAGISAQEGVQLAGIQAGVQTADLNNQAALAQAGIYRDIFTSAQQTQQVQANDAAAVAINGQNVQGSVLTTQINDQTAVALAPYQTISTLAKTGDLQRLTSTKDAFLNLGGFSVGRATNFTPPGATQGQPSALSGFLTGVGKGIGNALPFAFGA